MPPLISCQSLTKTFFARPLFHEISLSLQEGECVGLIGPNGAGKSTFLKILAGLEKPDSGVVAPKRGLRVAYVAQSDVFAPGVTLAEALRQALEGKGLDAFECETQVQIMVAKIGFADPEILVERLSGGWRKRLALACALICEPELILLDEPTNHLDIEGVLWLERLIQQSKAAFLVVSHDRYFLESVATRMVELNRAYPDGFLSMEGNYSDFLIQKEDFLAAQVQLQNTLNTKAKREVAWLRQGAPARSTKAKYRIEAAGKLLEDLADVSFRNSQTRTALDIDFSATNRKGNELLVLRDVEKSLGGKRLFSDVNLALSHKTRLGVMGRNGCGKTTLLRIMAGDLEPDAGSMRRANGLRVLYFDQNRADLDPKLTLRNALSPNSDYVQYQGSAIHVAGWAQRFLFQSDQLDMPVGELSGGERARVVLAQLMLQPADLLILDEPTNDLDIPSLEVLEESLLEFPGAVVLVTHDRYLLDRVATLLLSVEGDGTTANYAEYSQWQDSHTVATLPAPKPVSKSAPPPSVKSLRRLSTAEQRELEGMEAQILGAEEQLEGLQSRLQAPEFVSNHTEMDACWKAIQAQEGRIMALYARWEELEARNK